MDEMQWYSRVAWLAEQVAYKVMEDPDYSQAACVAQEWSEQEAEPVVATVAKT